MADTKFTQGPWKAIPDIGARIPDKIYRVVGPSEVVCGDDGICTHDHYNDRSFEEDRANMHLIAAAPELYEALEASNKRLKTLLFEGEDQPLVLSNAKALAKARGEA